MRREVKRVRSTVGAFKKLVLFFQTLILVTPDKVMVMKIAPTYKCVLNYYLLFCSNP